LLSDQIDNMEKVWLYQEKPFQLLSSLRKKEAYFDATIACEGKYFKVHRMILSAYSSFLEELFDNASSGLQSHLLVHPVIVLQGVRKEHMEAVLKYVYNGRVNIAKTDVQMFMETIKYLKIKGLHEFKNYQVIKDNSTSENKRKTNPDPMISASVNCDREISMPIVSASIDFSEEDNVSISASKDCNEEVSKPVSSESVDCKTTVIRAGDQNDTPTENESNCIYIKEEPICEISVELAGIDPNKYIQHTDTFSSAPKKRKFEDFASSSTRETPHNLEILEQMLPYDIKDTQNIEWNKERNQIETHCRAIQGRAIVDEWSRPVYSFPCLIALALKNSVDGALTSTQICNFVCKNFPYYKTRPRRWRKNVTDCLYASPYFMIKPDEHSIIKKEKKFYTFTPGSLYHVNAELHEFKGKYLEAIKKSMKYPNLLENLEQGTFSFGEVSAQENQYAFDFNNS